VHQGELAHRTEAGELHGVFAVALALHVLPPPGRLVGVGHLDRDPQRAAQVDDPPGGVADLDHHPVDGAVAEQRLEVGGACRDGAELVAGVIGPVPAGHALGFAEIDCENQHNADLRGKEF
jgi:hypothetical protein